MRKTQFGSLLWVENGPTKRKGKEDCTLMAMFCLSKKIIFFYSRFFCRIFFQFLITFFTSLVEKLKKINFFFFIPKR